MGNVFKPPFLFRCIYRQPKEQLLFILSAKESLNKPHLTPFKQKTQFSTVEPKPISMLLFLKVVLS